MKGLAKKVSLHAWDLSKYPKVEATNNQVNEGDLTEEDEKAYSEVVKKFYGVGECVENIPQDEMWLGSDDW